MDFVNWIKYTNNNIILNPNLVIKDTGYGGLGVFYQNNNSCTTTSINTHTNNNANIELMRIPKKFTFSLDTLKPYVNELPFIKGALMQLNIDAEFNFVNKYLSETTLLVYYMCLFFSMSKLGHQDLPQFLIRYIKQVLLKTNICKPIMYEDEEDLEDYWNLSYSAQKRLSKEYGFVTQLYTFLTESLNLSIELDECKQIYAAVTSRVLEIPEEVNRNNDDFTINTTLVPMLDFVNHDNDQKNAYFDVDRNTNDVLLLLENKNQQESVFEIFISYDPVEELAKFDFTYGFIPKNLHHEQIFKLELSPSLVPKEHRILYKWFKIPLYVNLKVLPYSTSPIPIVEIEDSDQLVLLSLPYVNDLIYDTELEEKLIKDLNTLKHPNPRVYALTVIDIMEAGNTDENEEDALLNYIDFPQLRYSYEDSTGRNNKLEKQDVLNLVNVCAEIKKKFINDFLLKYCKKRLEYLENEVDTKNIAIANLEMDILKSLTMNNSTAKMDYIQDYYCSSSSTNSENEDYTVETYGKSQHDKLEDWVKEHNDSWIWKNIPPV
ncbi:uncharacterized protein SCODWIG_03168 [Saccharomycodes ludwigii]|uniref:SET domain-containing protein n=1 Tax=Saccharomycodes ludwigii TaxID=36035 RepID=A0A376B9S0_9ASCO|nr:hypothetical protein SCDLUD_003199 [Saccharomycodes ludwigii]KAH3900228.1 hypothetical protein SCDLUD_003199 [Saccharomycodes ludwigii]SSD61407.1 uncharacterized protein SCODWIG_03168 [Saccharomycodes ludwigii]